MLGGARRLAAAAALPAALVAAAQPAVASSGGRVGRSGRQNATCNECHAGGIAPDVAFVLPEVVHAGETVTVRFTVHAGSPAGKAAGFNVAVESGTLITIPGAGTHLSQGEITHNEPQGNDAGRNAGWDFKWIAPADPGRYRLWGAGNSVNMNGQSSGDRSAATVLRVDVVAAEPSPTPTSTSVPATATPTASATAPPTVTPSRTATTAPTSSPPPTATASRTATAAPTDTASPAPTNTAPSTGTPSAPPTGTTAAASPTVTDAPTATPTIGDPTSTATLPPPSETPTASPPPSITAAPFCPGDCNGDGMVSINELVLAVAIALETQPLTACPESDSNRDGRVAINELIEHVNGAQSACSL